MFLKLNFSTAKTPAQMFHLLHHIIKNPSITNIDEFLASVTAAGFNSSTLSGFEAQTSELISTVDRSRVDSHIRKTSTANTFVWTLEFTVNTDNTKKYYIQFNNSSNAANYVSSIRTQPSAPIGSTINVSDDIVWSSTTGSGSTINLSDAPGFETAREIAGNTVYIPGSSTCLWVYLTNDAFLFATTNTTYFPSGWHTTYSNSSAYSGIHIYSQYQPFDYYNTIQNNIVPLAFTNHWRNAVPFLVSTDWAGVHNPNVARSPNAANSLFQVLNTYSAHPTQNPAWTRLESPFVTWGSGSRTNEAFGLNVESLGSTSVLSTARYGRVVNTTALQRYVSTDRKSAGYAMLPIRWELSYYGNRGGNISSIGKFFLFNGEYVPGDLFQYENKTYMIWPGYAGHVNTRLGLAIPKE
jgi:hypothetical protein